MKKIVPFIILIIILSCKNEPKSKKSETFITPIIEYQSLKKDIVFKYSKGLTIEGSYDKYIITIKSSWKDSQEHLIYELLDSTIAYTGILPKHLDRKSVV